jgi:hypothetical protein
MPQKKGAKLSEFIANLASGEGCTTEGFSVEHQPFVVVQQMGFGDFTKILQAKLYFAKTKQSIQGQSVLVYG